MRPVDQTILGRGGDCFSACLASILEIPLDEVPHVMIEDDYEGALSEFLRLFDLWSLKMDVAVCRGIELAPVGYHVISGPSPRQVDGKEEMWHAVVGYNGEMVHDPHPSRTGLREEVIWRVFVRRFEEGEMWRVAWRDGLTVPQDTRG